MDFLTFLPHALDNAWWQSQNVVSCVGPDSPTLFFAMLVEHCKKHGVVSIQTVDLTDSPLDQTSAQLSCQFLGTRSYYWVKNIALLDAKKRAYWTSFLQGYQGPNCLIFFSDKKLIDNKNKYAVSVDIPDELEVGSFPFIFDYFLPGEQRRTSLLIRHLTMRRRKISLDTLCLLTQYMTVLGSDLELFLTKWLDAIVVPESSLFDLSKYLFARNAQYFFELL